MKQITFSVVVLIRQALDRCPSQFSAVSCDSRLQEQPLSDSTALAAGPDSNATVRLWLVVQATANNVRAVA